MAKALWTETDWGREAGTSPKLGVPHRLSEGSMQWKGTVIPGGEGGISPITAKIIPATMKNFTGNSDATSSHSFVQASCP